MEVLYINVEECNKKAKECIKTGLEEGKSYTQLADRKSFINDSKLDKEKFSCKEDMETFLRIK